VLEGRLAARLLAGALWLGFVGQLLFVGQLPGINVGLWIASLLLAAFLARPARARIDPTDLWLPIAALVFAAMVALRADPALLLFDTLVAVGLAGAGMVALAGVPVTRRPALGVVRLAFAALRTTLSGVTRLTPGFEAWRGLSRPVRASTGARVVRGLLLALPLLLVFAVLFAAADAVFARVFGDLFAFSVDPTDLAVRATVLSVATWLSAGLLVAVADPGPAAIHPELSDEAAREDPAERARVFTLGTLEATVVLVTVDLLFAAFVALQAAYLFGGLDTLAASGLTYSAYARRGFFELIAVALGAGAVIVVMEVIVATRTRPYVIAALALAGLTAVVLASAVVRLSLYQAAYGWTELRFYALAAIGWLGIGLLAAAIALATDRSRWLVHALVISGLAVALAVNVVDPQAFVARQNVERALHPELVPADGKVGLDASYLGRLGDDAVPVLLDALPSLPDADRERLRDALWWRVGASRSRGSEVDGWPSYNVARDRARLLLREADGILGPP
jgi:hypothetical protein